jgi:ribosomal protein S18 acetylase RimI-like enzyme
LILDEHRRAMLLAVGRAPGAEERDDAEVQWVLGGSPAGFFNCVVRADLTSDAPIAAFLERLGQKRLAGTWHLGPSMRPSDLARRLIAHGFEHAGDDIGMQRDLDDLPALEMPSGVIFERISSEDGLRTWTDTMVRAFELPCDWTAWFEARCRALGFGAWIHYLGRVAGQPVATATLFTNAGIAGIHNVGTLPDARRRGLAGALTLAALHEARSRGLQQAVLHASEMGQPVYERLGFRRICATGLYRWRPAS